MLPHRPTSAPSQVGGRSPDSRGQLREYQQLVRQLRNTIEEIKRGPHPQDADMEEISRRRQKLERVLRDVEESIQHAKEDEERRYNSRFCAAVRNQMRKEEEIRERHNGRFVRSQHAQESYWGETMGRRHAKVIESAQRTQRAEDFLETQATLRCERNAALLDHQREVAKRLEQEVSEKRAASAARHRQATAHFEELRHRKEVLDARKEAESTERYAKHAQYCARQKKLAEEAKARATAKLHEERSVKRAHGFLNQVKVTLRPHPALTIVQKSYEQLLQGQHDAEAAQRRRYEEEEAARMQARRQNQLLREARLRQQEEKRQRILEEHLVAGERIKGTLREKQNHLEQFHAARDEYYHLTGTRRREEIVQHLQRSKESKAQTAEKANRVSFQRWSRRADHIMDHILRSYRTGRPAALSADAADSAAAKPTDDAPP